MSLWACFWPFNAPELEAAPPLPTAYGAHQKKLDPELLLQSLPKHQVVVIGSQRAFYLSLRDPRFSNKWILNIENGLVTPFGVRFRLLSVNNDGHSGTVYKMMSVSSGELYCLKLAISLEFEFLTSILKERKKWLNLERLGIARAEIREYGVNYCVKDWIDGDRGDVWMRRWALAGQPSDDRVFLALLALWECILDRGAYVQNLKAHNCIWDGVKWVIIDIGATKWNVPRGEALVRFHRTFNRHWVHLVRDDGVSARYIEDVLGLPENPIMLAERADANSSCSDNVQEIALDAVKSEPSLVASEANEQSQRDVNVDAELLGHSVLPDANALPERSFTPEQRSQLGELVNFYSSIVKDTRFADVYFITPVLKIGDSVITPQGVRCKIAALNDTGHTGVVFRAQVPDAQRSVCLKLALQLSFKMVHSMLREAQKSIVLKRFGVPHAEILEYGRNYAVKEWIFGLTGGEWFLQWVRAGAPKNDEKFVALMSTFNRLSEMQLYLQNLKGDNLIWTEHGWIVVDVGAAKYPIAPREALDRYHRTFDRRWNGIGHKRGCLCPPLEQILRE
jgi:hypothetical protein